MTIVAALQLWLVVSITGEFGLGVSLSYIPYLILRRMELVVVILLELLMPLVYLLYIKMTYLY